ncbi:MAG TPA: hydrogenase maturation nickel metallochaperone HypA [Spirochaetota bacterium]|nr:hydrogenase maturation nickel metallochaperone HypA [Spirochaetota bacterium]
MSIAAEITKRIKQEAKHNQASAVYRVHLTIGALSGIVKEALEFALQACSEDKLFKHTEWLITTEAARVYCAQCQTTTTPDPPLIYCTKCLSTDVTVTSGKTMIIDSIELA